jgi:hypothetical protein
MTPNRRWEAEHAKALRSLDDQACFSFMAMTPDQRSALSERVNRTLKREILIVNNDAPVKQ